MLTSGHQKLLETSQSIYKNHQNKLLGLRSPHLIDFVTFSSLIKKNFFPEKQGKIYNVFEKLDSEKV